jgi:hypothetical protein
VWHRVQRGQRMALGISLFFFINSIRPTEDTFLMTGFQKTNGNNIGRWKLQIFM